ncbi:MAG: FG-GAP repeat domain-containing protein [Paraclostridium sp.]
MKLLRVIALVLFVSYFNVGCTSTQSPEQLIKKPIYDEEKQSIYDNINRVLDKNATIILPKNSSEISSINNVDLDNDGVNELIVFERKEDIENDKTEVGFITLNEENGKIYTIKDEYITRGSSIEYANFYDLDDDGKKEIILVTKTDTKSKMEVLRFENNEIIKLTQLAPTWIEDRNSYTEMSLQIGDLNDDGKQELIILSHNPKSYKMVVSLAYFDKYIRLIDFKTFNDVKSLENFYADIYQVHPDKKGIVIDTKSSKEKDAYITQILYLEDKQLKKAFNNENSKLKKQYYMPVEDINGDGIIEIPVVNNTSRGYRTKSSANVSWHSWNGEDDEFINLSFVSQIYYNYKNNFKLWIPNSIANKISIEEDYKENKVSFEFYYYDSLNYQSESQKIFTITKTTKNKIDESKGNNNANGGFVLSENDTDMYILLINNPKILKKLDIKAEAIKEYFSTIYTVE